MDELSTAIATADALPLELNLSAVEERALDTLVAVVREGSVQESAYAESLASLWALAQRAKRADPADVTTQDWRAALFCFAEGALSLVLQKAGADPVVDVHADPAGRLCLIGVSDADAAALLTQHAQGVLTLNAGELGIREVPMSPSAAGHWALGGAPGNRFPPRNAANGSADLPVWFRAILSAPLPRPAEMPQPHHDPIAQPSAPVPAWACVSCGSVPTSVDARFCRSCGARLPQPPASQRLCGQCGSPLRAQSRFCAKCGAPASA